VDFYRRCGVALAPAGFAAFFHERLMNPVERTVARPFPEVIIDRGMRGKIFRARIMSPKERPSRRTDKNSTVMSWTAPANTTPARIHNVPAMRYVHTAAMTSHAALMVSPRLRATTAMEIVPRMTTMAQADQLTRRLLIVRWPGRPLIDPSSRRLPTNFGVLIFSRATRNDLGQNGVPLSI
jgi:hypothetical protein